MQTLLIYWAVIIPTASQKHLKAKKAYRDNREKENTIKIEPDNPTTRNTETRKHAQTHTPEQAHINTQAHTLKSRTYETWLGTELRDDEKTTSDYSWLATFQKKLHLTALDHYTQF